jgi:Protein of unknown function (DUF1566)
MKLSRPVFAFATVAAALSNPVCAIPVSGQGTWQTTLLNRDLNGDGVIDAFYDTNLNITWMRNANSNGNGTQSPSGLPNGNLTWNAATSWASSLNLGGIGGWRLPTTNDTGAAGCNGVTFTAGDCGWNVDVSTGNTVNSELAHLFYVTLGNKGYLDTNGNLQVGSGFNNTGEFQNFASFYYWSSTSVASDPTKAWAFSTYSSLNQLGNQDTANKNALYYAIAVHAGDVGGVPVPLPATAALLTLGGLGLLRSTFRRK